MHRLCQIKLQGKSVKALQSKVPLSKNVSKDICTCLFEKNKLLSIAELEQKVASRTETPASSCISILDTYLQKINNKTIKSKKSN